MRTIEFPTNLNELEPPIFTHRVEVLGILAVYGLDTASGDDALISPAFSGLYTNEHGKNPETDDLSGNQEEELRGHLADMGLLDELDLSTKKDDTILVDGAKLGATKYRLEFLGEHMDNHSQVSVSGGQRSLTADETISLRWTDGAHTQQDMVRHLLIGDKNLTPDIIPFPNGYASPYPIPEDGSPEFAAEIFKDGDKTWQIVNAPAVMCNGTNPRPNTGSMAHFYASLFPTANRLVVVMQQPYALRCGFDIANNVAKLEIKPHTIKMTGPPATEIGSDLGVLLGEIGSMARQAAEFRDMRV